jgi:competence CoiA-like predicted nuclease
MKRIKIPESKVLKELHDIRRRIQKRAERVGWEKYLEELNKRPALWVEKRVSVVREKPTKYGK